MLLKELILDYSPEHFPTLGHSDGQVPISVFIQVIPDLPWLRQRQMPVIHTDLVMTVLYRDHDVPV